MLATSSGWAQRILGANWKRLHRLVWFAIPLSLAHALVAGGLEPPAILLYGGIMAFAAFEYRALAARVTGGARTHIVPVGAGALAALIYVML
jgi:DMSO/TMAO reductase YedYZ heme-binding membrane subunit